MKVPSTQTYSDVHAEIKKLREEISNLKIEKDIVSSKTEEAKLSLNDVENRVTSASKLVEELGLLIQESIKQTKESINDTSVIVRECQKVIDMYKIIIVSLDEKLDNQLKNLGETKEQVEAEHVIIVEEREKLNFYKKDLDIYRARINNTIINNNIGIPLI